ncbi:MAG: N-acetylmuramoyl-L-alanine amidase [Nitrospinae bacterium]|nr:N-acetylmuramoyl-L-alanine amidase [Nitrospinota bacterium]
MLLLSYVGGADSTGLKTVVIDPGHGGSDKGGEGKDGLLEKDAALQISLSLKRMILNDMKLKVVMTRESDADIPLERRVALANKSKGDLLISIHTGASYSESSGGIRVYYLDYEEMRKELASGEQDNGNETAGSENEENDLSIILKDMTHSDYASEGAKIAELIQKNLTEIISDQKITLKPMPALIMKDADMPAIMIEVGNITNHEDAGRLRNREYINRIAGAIAKAVKEYY